KADVNFWRGRALADLGRKRESESAYRASAEDAFDFQHMSVTAHSATSYYQAAVMLALGRAKEATQLAAELQKHGQFLQQAQAKIDYFATSLPNLLVLEEDLGERNRIEGLHLEGLARLLSNDTEGALAFFCEVVRLDPAHQDASEKLREFGTA